MQRRHFLGSTLLAFAAASPSVPAFAANEFADVDAPAVPAPKGALSLFDGRNLDGWLARKGGPANWKVKDGYFETVPLPGNVWIEGAGDIYTKEVFGDHQLHVEFWLPPPMATYGRANSGVYVQGRYEVQVLDSYGLPLTKSVGGAVYSIAAPLRNVSKKPGRWQSYDMAFRSPRVEGGQVREKARITVFQNNVLVQNNTEVPKATPEGLDTDVTRPGPVMLQDYPGQIRYRNIWVFAG